MECWRRRNQHCSEVLYVLPKDIETPGSRGKWGRVDCRGGENAGGRSKRSVRKELYTAGGSSDIKVVEKLLLSIREDVLWARVALFPVLPVCPVKSVCAVGEFVLSHLVLFYFVSSSIAIS